MGKTNCLGHQHKGGRRLPFAELLPVILIIAVMLGFRARRTMTIQPLRPVMLIGRMVVLALLAVIILLNSTPQWIIYGGGFLGLASAWIFSHYTLRLTRFEKNQEGLTYRTNPYIGGIVVIVTLVRLIINTSTVFALKVSAPSSGPVVASQGPLTMAIFFLFLGYWFFYYWGILHKARILLADVHSAP
jgi:hypothetical protein